ncbi:siroheme decarboxylase subunit beta [Crenobacter caeni]|uniref:siroheme decarboxylase n=1 Tax=Crenobacter caeni TaxID=2705474 RepID=A0A6B2KUX8_9NEIS|nr:Lrp/AsnC family transcriptional regulator [Crenobacter caeni]NDV14042.1 Lrp/AsnC family transcriptional regulator [Crenobacter caeni]
MTPELDELDSRLIDNLQADFPLLPRPFAALAPDFGLDETTLIGRLSGLLERGVLTRFGPLYQIERLGGVFMLAALQVPEAVFDKVAQQVNAYPQVAHNYRREHPLNMWFVLAADSDASLQAAAAAISSQTGLQVHCFPKEREYFVGMRFSVGGHAPVGACALATPPLPYQAQPEDLALVRATQQGLPLLAQPYLEVGRGLDMSCQQVRDRLARLLASGVIRRIGVVPNHYAIGYLANGMAVFDVDDDQVDAAGEAIGRLPFVSHCYRRARHRPAWPYNLFAMCHGATRAAVMQQQQTLRALLGSDCRGSDVLFSCRILKKTGLRL